MSDAARRGAKCEEAMGDGGSSTATRKEVASIHVTKSTNEPSIDVAVYDDGSADRTVGTERATVALFPKTYPAHSPEVVQFLCDLEAAGDVAGLGPKVTANVSTNPGCTKSGSFGTFTTITAAGHTSGDIQCLKDTNVRGSALAVDCRRLPCCE